MAFFKNRKLLNIMKLQEYTEQDIPYHDEYDNDVDDEFLL